MQEIVRKNEEAMKKKCNLMKKLHFWFNVAKLRLMSYGRLFYSCALGVVEFISAEDEEVAVAKKFGGRRGTVRRLVSVDLLN